MQVNEVVETASLVPNRRFKQLHGTCQFPNGVQDDVRVFCGGDAVEEVEGYLFCSLHAPMAERGCLDLEYSDGTTLRGIIESAEQEQA